MKVVHLQHICHHTKCQEWCYCCSPIISTDEFHTGTIDQMELESNKVERAPRNFA